MFRSVPITSLGTILDPTRFLPNVQLQPQQDILRRVSMYVLQLDVHVPRCGIRTPLWL